MNVVFYHISCIIIDTKLNQKGDDDITSKTELRKEVRSYLNQGGHISDLSIDYKPTSAREAIQIKLKHNNHRALDANYVGHIMMKYYHFKKLSNHLLMYISNKNNPAYGTYTSNYAYLEQQISRDYPQFKRYMFNDIVLYIKARAPSLDSDLNAKLISNLIPVNNGLFDFYHKKLIPFSPKYVFSNKITTDYNPNMTESPNINGWTVDKFFRGLADGDSEIVKQLWQIVLDAIDGNHCRRKLILLVSDNQGSNGKSTFQSLIQDLVGQNNYSSLKINQFDQRFMLSTLVGKAVDLGDNLPTNTKLTKSSNVNSIVTGDNVQIEQKNQKPYSAHLRCSVIQSCNGLPTFTDTGGVRRRLLIIPFNNHFGGKKDNPRVKDHYLKRRDVKEYVLYKALNQKPFTNIFTSEASRKALIDYECDNYPMIRFKRDYFDQWSINKIPTSLVFNWYNDFISDHDEYHNSDYTQRRFTKSFKPLIRKNYLEKPAKLTDKDRQALIDLKSGKGFGNIEDSEIPPAHKTLNCFVMR